MHESLLALFAVLNEWCVSAAATQKFLNDERERRAKQASNRYWQIVESGAPMNVGPPVLYGYTDDIKALLTPKPQLTRRWSKAERRRAARRGLGTLLSAYFPEFYVQFSEATTGRAELALSIDQKSLREMPQGELESIYERSTETLKDLVAATNALGDIIESKFPIDPQSPGT
ncbi:hypothetical protein ABTW72_12180 [Micromonospora sp. NPDC127501]|uniref:hypothetical protein n=1 Tax=Micromonospora sp. NPDC127501 TaxID=3154872 RepID=UPI00332CC6B6